MLIQPSGGFFVIKGVCVVLTSEAIVAVAGS